MEVLKHCGQETVRIGLSHEYCLLLQHVNKLFGMINILILHTCSPVSSGMIWKHMTVSRKQVIKKSNHSIIIKQ